MLRLHPDDNVHMELPPEDRDALLLKYLSKTSECCPRCRFPLQGLAECRCPECGEQLQLQVGTKRMVIGWIVLAIIPSGFSMIATIMLGIPLLDELARPSIGSSIPIEFLLAEGFGVLSTCLGLAIFWLRERFVVLPEHVQAGIAGLVWLVHISVAMALFFVL